mgnify:CR=1 FL=1
MNNLIFKAPINSLSFGNVSFNILKEIFKKGIDLALFPIGKVDINSFGEQPEDFKSWLEDSINNRFSKLNKDTTTLQMWHLNGSENRISRKQILYTFFELDKPTDSEIKFVSKSDVQGHQQWK